MKIDEATYTVLDVETTGLYPKYGDRICEIGALKAYPDGRKETFETLIDPERAVSPGAFRVNHISAEMLTGQPLIADILPGLMSFIDGSVLVGYNTGFDLGFLSSELGEHSDKLKGALFVDALKLARNLFPGLPRYNLSAVSGYLNIDVTDQHRAMADVNMTWEVFSREIDLLKEKGEIDLSRISEKFAPYVSSTPRAALNIENTIQKAIDTGRRLNIKYRSLWNDKSSTRQVTPLSLRKTDGNSYLIAFCHLRGDRRNFRLDCILEASPRKDRA